MHKDTYDRINKIIRKPNRILISDLDSTLLHRTELDIDKLCENKVIDIYTRKNETIGTSSMTNKALAMLKEINESEDRLFIPVTTRTREQFTRINFGFFPKIAFVENGATILLYSETAKKYDVFENPIVDNSVDFEKMSKIIKNTDIFSEYEISDIEIVGKYFMLFKIINTNGSKEINNIEISNRISSAIDSKCYSYQLGDYAYIVPVNNTKASAVNFLESLFEFSNKKIVIAGDSLMDSDMMFLGHKKSNNRIAIAPKDSRIYAKYKNMELKILFTKESGIKSAENIIEML